MGGIYKDKAWLHGEYITKNKSAREIGNDVNVSYSTILYWLQKHEIKKDEDAEREARVRRLKADRVVLACEECKAEFNIRRQLHKTKVASGQSKFYCGKRCSGKALSKKRKGVPNLKHPYNEDHPSHREYIEKLSVNSKRQMEKYIKDGSMEWRLSRLYKGREDFQETEEGRKALYYAGVQAVKSQRGRSSSIEIKMRDELTSRLIPFVEQYPIGNRFVSDFYIPKYNIIIECDGNYWHNLPEVKERDKMKNELIKNEGRSLYRFWESEINESVEACVDVVMIEINDNKATA